MKILLTSTSFQDTPGKHQELLTARNFEIHTLRGPLKEAVLLECIDRYDGLICGDDEITAAVIAKAKSGRLKVISKYGIGLDKIDLDAAGKNNIPVTNCPGMNHITVAEHVFSLILTFYKNICQENEITHRGEWKRLIGHEIFGKRLGIFGLGRIGKEIAIRARIFGMKVYAVDKYVDEDFNKRADVQMVPDIQELAGQSDIISLNTNLSKETAHVISMDLVSRHIRKGTVLVNTARGGLVDERAILYGLDRKIIRGYLTDVLDEEPVRADHPFLKYENVLITPHIGSRTYESVERQGTMAVENLLKYLI